MLMLNGFREKSYQMKVYLLMKIFFEKTAHIRKGLLQQAKNLKSCLFRKKKKKKEGMIF